MATEHNKHLAHCFDKLADKEVKEQILTAGFTDNMHPNHYGPLFIRNRFEWGRHDRAAVAVARITPLIAPSVWVVTPENGFVITDRLGSADQSFYLSSRREVEAIVKSGFSTEQKKAVLRANQISVHEAKHLTVAPILAVTLDNKGTCTVTYPDPFARVEEPRWYEEKAKSQNSGPSWITDSMYLNGNGEPFARRLALPQDMGGAEYVISLGYTIENAIGMIGEFPLMMPSYDTASPQLDLKNI